MSAKGSTWSFLSSYNNYCTVVCRLRMTHFPFPRCLWIVWQWMISQDIPKGSKPNKFYCNISNQWTVFCHLVIDILSFSWTYLKCLTVNNITRHSKGINTLVPVIKKRSIPCMSVKYLTVNNITKFSKEIYTLIHLSNQNQRIFCYLSFSNKL